MITPTTNRYKSPKTNVYRVVVGKFCIGFGEGSIPPEESDINMGWMDDEFSEDFTLPKSSIKLWED